MRVVTVLGTRPEIIRLSLIVEKLDKLVEHVLVHTGQNFDPSLSDVFFENLGVRSPDAWLGARGQLSEQVGEILKGCERILREVRPDRILILGDTNSGLSAFIAKRMGIPVFHMEAGNRCFDDRVPEEVNRRVIDHCSDVLMPYTERSRQNLLAEGFRSERVLVTGNPIFEVISHFRPSIDASDILNRLQLEPGRYMLATLHREENVDAGERLARFTQAFADIAREHKMPIIVSTHPRTRKRLVEDHEAKDNVRYLEPFGFFDFLRLENDATCVLSDSGTVQEECCIFRMPNITIRDVTERPETLESVSYTHLTLPTILLV